MDREQAFQILTRYLTNPNLVNHSLAAEAAMRALAKKLGGEENIWGITGLLHDADYEMSKGSPQMHGLLLFEREKSIPEDIAYAIKSHNYQNTKVLPKSQMDWAITCCDQLTGLIVAATLIHPDRKLKNVSVDFVLNRMKKKDFAKGADRTQILLCEEKLGIPVNEFIQIVLTSMQEISDKLGL